MKNISNLLSHVLVALIAAALTLFLFAGEERGKLQELQALISNRFIGTADQTAMEDAAAQGMIEALGDRWSHYLTAEEYESYKEQMENSYVGIGVTILTGTEGRGLEIVEVSAGGPAQEAGIQAGDRIIAVDGKQIGAEDINNASDHIKGEAGTVVSITVLRQEQELTFPVTRRAIQTVVASGELLENGIGLVTIENFDARCAQETIAAIELLLEQGAQNLIFDVRNNPGGYKNELVELLDYLLPEGVLFRSELSDGTKQEDVSDARELDVPMAVLVNGDSYSAAEFFAAALQDFDKAVAVVGSQTCGKGYFQSTFPLQDGSAVVLSVGKYYTPKGVSLADVGITPDISVEVDEETYAKIYYNRLEPQEDPQIQAAAQALADQ